MGESQGGGCIQPAGELGEEGRGRLWFCGEVVVGVVVLVNLGVGVVAVLLLLLLLLVVVVVS